jgi:hypothetical protein
LGENSKWKFGIKALSGFKPDSGDEGAAINSSGK